MALGYAWFDSYDSVGYVLTLHIFPPSRRARAATRFFQLSDVWSDVNLCDHTKINLYRSLVVYTFTYGHEAWLLDQTLLRQVNGFNARCLSKITMQATSAAASSTSYERGTGGRAAREWWTCLFSFACLAARRVFRLRLIPRYGP